MVKKAEFIMHEKSTADGGAVHFRKEFDANNTVKATLYISAHGLYEAYVNGNRVGDFILSPGYTSDRNRIQYQKYDITDMLCQKNVIDVEIHHGWIDNFSYIRLKTKQHPKLIALIELVDADGKVTEIATDGSWQVCTSPVRFASIYDGETYDARIAPEPTGEYANCKPGLAKQRLMPQQGEKIIEHESYPALDIIHTPAGETVIDFGYNLVGYVELTVQNGRAGDEISYTHAEVLDKHGNFYTENLRSAKQKVTYIAKDGYQTYKPHFTFMGGRYIRLDKFPYEVKKENFRFTVVHSDIKRTGHFECSSEMLNKLYDNIIRGQRGNYVDVPTDCPQRDERLGWTADTQVFTKTGAYNFDIERFMDKWLYDLMLDQRGDGSVPSVIPNPVGTTEDYRSAAWMDAATVCPWIIYLMYGNREMLSRQFESMQRYVNYLDRFGGDKYMWNGEFRHYGDWLALDLVDTSVIGGAKSGSSDLNKGGTDHKYIAQVCYAMSTEILIKAGKVLGCDMSYYQDLYDGIVKAFREHYMKDGLPLYKTQTACVLALHFNLCEDADREKVADLLCKLIHERGDTLTTGFVGTPYLLHALTSTGHADLAYTLALQEKYPSWLYSVKMGATTIWEHWDGIDENGDIWSPSMNSFNHYAYGSIGEWMYGTMAGIDVDESRPAFENIKLSPVIDKRLSYVKASLDTKYGTVKSQWNLEGDTVTYRFTVPSEADITINGSTEHVGAGEYTYTHKL